MTLPGGEGDTEESPQTSGPQETCKVVTQQNILKETEVSKWLYLLPFQMCLPKIRQLKSKIFLLFDLGYCISFRQNIGCLPCQWWKSRS